MWNKCNCAVIWTFFGTDFLWDWIENWTLQSCGHCWVFQICWHNECSTLTASSYKIWSSSAGISSLPLASFVVILPKAYLSSHCMISGSKWVTTSSQLTGSLSAYLYSSSVCSCHFFLISSASVRSLPFLSSFVPIFACNIPLVSPVFLKICLVFPVLLFFSISLYCSLKKTLY